MSMMPPDGGRRPGAPEPKMPGEELDPSPRLEADERQKAAQEEIARRDRTRRTTRRIVLLVLVLVAAGVVWWLTPRGGSKPETVWDHRPVVTSTKITGPMLAVSANGKWFAVAWAEGRKVCFMRGTEVKGQLQFDAAVALPDTSHPFAAFDEDPPKVAIDSNGEVAIAWMTRPTGREEGSVIAVARPNLNRDGALAVTRIESPNPKGFLLCESIEFDDDGGLVATWIDGGVPDESRGEVGTLQCALAPPQGAFESITSLADSVCSCCRTSLSWSGPEQFVVAYRGVDAKNSRDIRFAMLMDEGEDGAGTPAFSRNSHTIVRDDGWVIEGCPSQGPTVAAQGSSAAWVSWYTEGKPAGLYLARMEPSHSTDGTRWRTAESMVIDPRERAMHPVVATLSSGRPVVVFDGPTPEGGRALFARAYRGGKLEPSERLTTATRSERPAVARWGRNGVLVAWQEMDELGPRLALSAWKGL